MIYFQFRYDTPFLRFILGLAVFLFLTLTAQAYFLLSDGDRDASGDEVVEIDMRVVKGKWQFDPNEIVAPAGALVRVNIFNEDSHAHGFAIAELGVNHNLPGLKETTVEFVADIEPGEYMFSCSVLCGAGHFQQKGTLIVTESGHTLTGSVDTKSDLPVRSSKDAIARLPYEEKDGVKEFRLTAEEVLWDYGDGKIVESWGYNGQLPGPEIRVTEGDRVRVVITNDLPVATSMHWHGVDLENSMDGVPGVTQLPIGPGETFVYEFDAYPAGTRIYHTHGSGHSDSGEQMDMGLAGPLIIEPREYDSPDREYTLMLTERIGDGLYPINGAVHPHTEPIRVSEGDRVRIRMINAGSATIHPMHLHGHQFRVIAADGNPIPEVAQLTRNVQPVLPGETYDVEFIADNPGHWLLHCHQLQHAAGGMVLDVLYDEFDGEFVY